MLRATHAVGCMWRRFRAGAIPHRKSASRGRNMGGDESTIDPHQFAPASPAAASSAASASIRCTVAEGRPECAHAQGFGAIRRLGERRREIPGRAIPGHTGPRIPRGNRGPSAVGGEGQDQPEDNTKFRRAFWSIQPPTETLTLKAIEALRKIANQHIEAAPLGFGADAASLLRHG